MNYRACLSLINDYMEGRTNLSMEEIKKRIHEAYEDDEINGSQYDHLLRLLVY